jgi:UDP-N-acetylglucosamine 2-epimerase (non-hydrolysing)
LNTGNSASDHYEQLSYLTTEIPKLFKKHNIRPDVILFLGDSNSAGVSFPLKKAGYRIGHIEAGMRSGDKRMLEELNRTVCDHCSDIMFVYHDDYRVNLERENITKNVFVVGNTIVEPMLELRSKLLATPKQHDKILLDIHRPENFNSETRLRSIISFANRCIERYNIPVKLLYFKRMKDSIDKYSIPLGNVEMVPLMSYNEYIESVYNSIFLISDSGTGQEEPALLETPVIVPRDFTERPQSYEFNCSVRLDLESDNSVEVFDWISKVNNGDIRRDTTWLGNGNTSDCITSSLYDWIHKV